MKNGHHSGKDFIAPVPAKGIGKSDKVYLLLEVNCTGKIEEMCDLVAGRVWSMDRVRSASAMLITSELAYRLASAEMQNATS